MQQPSEANVALAASAANYSNADVGMSGGVGQEVGEGGVNLRDVPTAAERPGHNERDESYPCPAALQTLNRHVQQGGALCKAQLALS